MLQTLQDSVQQIAETADAWKETKKERLAFAKVRNAELSYAKQLRRIARHIHDLVAGLQPGDVSAYDTLQRILEQYSYLLRPWAYSVAKSMLAEVSRRDLMAWKQHSKVMGIELRELLVNTPIGEELAFLLEQQVDLITSLPREAARRVHELVSGNLYSGARSSEVAKEIMKTGLVAQSRADMIARTETARAQSTLTMVRAKAVGSTHYVWMTVKDFRVRPELGIRDFRKLNTLAMGSHRKLHGTVQSWEDPPIVSPQGHRGHPGTWVNCRCYASPILRDLDERSVES
jgi:SPP1 gp7 family putative phage head morphogenesis protein